MIFLFNAIQASEKSDKRFQKAFKRKLNPFNKQKIISQIFYEKIKQKKYWQKILKEI